MLLARTGCIAHYDDIKMKRAWSFSIGNVSMLYSMLVDRCIKGYVFQCFYLIPIVCCTVDSMSRVHFHSEDCICPPPLWSWFFRFNRKRWNQNTIAHLGILSLKEWESMIVRELQKKVFSTLIFFFFFSLEISIVCCCLDSFLPLQVTETFREVQFLYLRFYLFLIFMQTRCYLKFWHFSFLTT